MAYIQGDVHRKSENLKIDISKEIGETERAGEQKKIKKGVIAVATVVVIALAVFIGVWLHNAPARRLAEQLDLGNRYLEEMDYEEAIVAFTKAIEIDPMSVDAYLGLVEAYIRQGDFEKALEYAKKGYEVTGDVRLKEKADMIESGEIFDSLGRIMKRTGYDENGNVSWWHEFTYNLKGQEAFITAYDATGRETGRIEETYDEEGNELNSYAFNDDNGEIILTKSYYQDGNMVREEWFQDSDGEELDFYRITKYNKNGKATGLEKYDKDEKLIGYITYEYDEDGNITKESYFDNYEDDEKFVLYRYDLLEYDDKGNCIKREGYDNNGKLTGYDLFKYDEDGIRIGWEYYDSGGNLIFGE